jgi:hypothetical protein
VLCNLGLATILFVSELFFFYFSSLVSDLRNYTQLQRFCVCSNVQIQIKSKHERSNATVFLFCFRFSQWIPHFSLQSLRFRKPRCDVVLFISTASRRLLNTHLVYVLLVNSLIFNLLSGTECVLKC